MARLIYNTNIKRNLAMSFIQKRIQQKKQEQEEQLKMECSYSILRIEEYTSYLKKDILNLINNRKSISPEFADNFIWRLERLEDLYNRFLHDLKRTEFTYKETYFKNVKEESKQKAEFMYKIKKQYRVEFEKIYDTFKRITKGNNFPRRNEILSLMRKAFDFDSSKYYAPERFIIYP